MSRNETHIASLVVHCRPEQAEGAAASIAAWPGAEIHTTTPEGKLVVILEMAREADILATMDQIRGLPGVLNTSLVFHHAEPTAALDEIVEPRGENP